MIVRHKSVSWLRGQRMRLILAFSLCLNTALLPLVMNEYLRWQYFQTISIWRSHFIRPEFVFVGDSITAGGRMFGRIDTINLGASGYVTKQVALALPKARSYNPRHIVVMAGTNDAMGSDLDLVELRQEWKAITSDPRVIVTLATPTRKAEDNARIALVNAIAREAARAGQRPIIELNELAGADGLLREEYSVDGVHLQPAAYAFWMAKLDARK